MSYGTTSWHPTAYGSPTTTANTLNVPSPSASIPQLLLTADICQCFSATNEITDNSGTVVGLLDVQIVVLGPLFMMFSSGYTAYSGFTQTEYRLLNTSGLGYHFCGGYLMPSVNSSAWSVMQIVGVDANGTIYFTVNQNNCGNLNVILWGTLSGINSSVPYTLSGSSVSFPQITKGVYPLNYGFERSSYVKGTAVPTVSPYPIYFAYASSSSTIGSNVYATAGIVFGPYTLMYSTSEGTTSQPNELNQNESYTLTFPPWLSICHGAIVWNTNQSTNYTVADVYGLTATTLSFTVGNRQIGSPIQFMIWGMTKGSVVSGTSSGSGFYNEYIVDYASLALLSAPVPSPAPFVCYYTNLLARTIGTGTTVTYTYMVLQAMTFGKSIFLWSNVNDWWYQSATDISGNTVIPAATYSSSSLTWTAENVGTIYYPLISGLSYTVNTVFISPMCSSSWSVVNPAMPGSNATEIQLYVAHNTASSLMMFAIGTVSN